MTDITNAWALREKGIDYNRKLNYYTDTDKNFRFYEGDQWRGAQANGLPTPVFNIFKRVIDHQISAVISNKLKMIYAVEGIDESKLAADDQMYSNFAKLLSQYSDELWEKLKMDINLRWGLLDGACSGDVAMWFWWEEKALTGEVVEGVPVQGEICGELVDGANVMFGNPNDPRVERQPYIILSFRALVSELRREAKKYKVKQSDIDKIVTDADFNDQAGDLSKIEIDGGENDGKCTAIIKLWKNEAGDVLFTKSTRAVDIHKDVNTGYKRYPLAWMNWGRRKNSYHGQAVGTGLIPNQIFINKMFAMYMISLMNTAFPKVVFNQALIDDWNNAVGEAIPVTSGEDMAKVAHYLQPATMSNQVINAIEAAIGYTKEMLGASDAALGDVKPENTSAIIAIQKASAIPLEQIKANLYQFVEDIGYIWFDMMAAKYGPRTVTVTDKNGLRRTATVDFNLLKSGNFRLKVDVGPSTLWSEITSLQTLDNLLRGKELNFVQYLERIPNGIIPKRDELITEIKELQAQAAMAQQQQAALPPPGPGVMRPA